MRNARSFGTSLSGPFIKYFIQDMLENQQSGRKGKGNKTEKLREKAFSLYARLLGSTNKGKMPIVDCDLLEWRREVRNPVRPGRGARKKREKGWRERKRVAHRATETRTVKASGACHWWRASRNQCQSGGSTAQGWPLTGSDWGPPGIVD